jgi:hypothetical protein
MLTNGFRNRLTPLILRGSIALSTGEARWSDSTELVEVLPLSLALLAESIPTVREPTEIGHFVHFR